MDDVDGERKRRVFRWSREARELVRGYQEQKRKPGERDCVERRVLITRLAEISGHPRDACLRFLRQLGVKEKRCYREWTKPEQQRLLDLIVSIPVEQAAKAIGRPPASVRSMLHRLEAGGRKGREWFTKSSLAAALHISPEEIQRWVDRGWLKSRFAETSGLRIQIIDPDDFCAFFKQYGRQVVGRRLSYEALWFVRNYVFPSSHAELFSLRERYKKRNTNATVVPSPDPEFVSEEGDDGGSLDRSA